LNASRKLKPSGPPRPLPPTLALGLGAVVLLAHLWLLARAPLPMAVQASEAAPLRFSTRRIEPAPAIGQPPTSRPIAQATAPPSTEPAQLTRARAADLASEQAPVAQAAPSEPVATPEAAAEAHAVARPTAQAHPPPAQTAPHPHLPGSVQLRYELSGRSRGIQYSADGELSWQQDSQHYEARMVISGVWMLRPRVMTSVGELGEQGVVPRRFSDKVRSEQATHFQPERGRVVFSSNAPEAAWQTGTQDRVSLFFQLAGLLAAEPARYPPGAQVQMPIAGTRELNTWTFNVTGTPTLELPFGLHETLALRREPRRDHDQTIEIWFAPALGYLPARIRITQANGDVIDQKLAAVSH
jgi:hypothetical protein